MNGFQGNITTSYAALRLVFGKPQRPSDKSSVEWRVAGKNVSIYDYREACPKDDTPFVFNVGGERRSDVQLVVDLLRAAGQTVSL